MAVTKDTIRRWRVAADKHRASAAKVRDPQARLGLLNAARRYDDMADGAEASYAGAGGASDDD